MTQVRQRLAAPARRQAVLDAAGRVFSRSSYGGATTAEIAREAGISEPILYRHFGSKRDLYLACVDQAWAELQEVAAEARATSPSGCLGVVANAYMASQARVRLVDLWIQALTVASDDPVIAKALKRQIRSLHEFFVTLIRDAQERGEVVAERDPVAEAWIFVASGLLATVDDRLGGLLGADLDRVRAERKRWLLSTS
jgi:TetR/AcrR family transcriptional regulator